MDLTMKSDTMKLGIVVGDGYGQTSFSTEITDPFKAIEQANEYIRSKYTTNVELGVVTQHKHKRT